MKGLVLVSLMSLSGAGYAAGSCDGDKHTYLVTLPGNTASNEFIMTRAQAEDIRNSYKVVTPLKPTVYDVCTAEFLD